MHKVVDKMEMVNQEGIILALIIINKLDVVLYGAGMAGYGILRRLTDIYGIRPICFVDKDVKKKGNCICGIPVVSPKDISKMIKNPSNTYGLIAVREYAKNDEVRKEIDSAFGDASIERHSVITWRSNDARQQYDEYFSSHEQEIEELEDILADEESKQVLKEWIRSWLEADLYLLPEHPFRYKYCGCDMDGNDEIYRHLDNEVFINCGSNIGDTIFQYLSCGYTFEQIHAYEGDEKIFTQLKKNIGLLDKDLQDRIVLHNEYIGTKDNEVDEQFGGQRITLVNADIEGAELSVLKGMSNIIRKQKPVLAFCVYHNPEDSVEISKYILSVDNSYRIFLRKYVHYDRNRWEVVMYAVPPERLLKKYA